MKKLFSKLMLATMVVATFVACEDVPEPYDVPQPGGDTTVPDTEIEGTTGDGTLANPYNAAAAIALAQKTGEAESEEVYIKGKVATITEQYGTQFGNATFTISDDGSTSSTTFTIYRALYLGNKRYSSGDLLKENDDVIICGKVTNFRGNTPETVQGAAFLYSLNGTTESSSDNPDPQPAGEVKTVTVAEFNAAEVSNSVWYQLTGKVTNLKDGDIYGNFDLVDETGSVYVYGLLSQKGGEKKLFQDLAAQKGIKENSTITLIGNRGDYNGKIEVVNAYFVSIEGGTDTPDDAEPNGGADASKKFGTLSGNAITLVAADLGIDNAAELNTITLVDGTTISFTGGSNANAPKYYNSGASIRMYPKNAMTVKASGKTIESITLACSSQSGTLCNASGEVKAQPGTVSTNGEELTISAISSSSTIITNSNGSTGAASQLRFSQLVITYAK